MSWFVQNIINWFSRTIGRRGTKWGDPTATWGSSEATWGDRRPASQWYSENNTDWYE